MTDPRQPGQAGQPNEEELRAHLAQLREADVAEVVVQAVNMLATGAQVKLGRPDARVLIDAVGAVAGAIDGRVPADLVRQVRDAVSQLQTAQVQAEREEAGAAATPQGAAERPGAGQGEQPSADQQAAGEGKLTDRLWIPGRGPGPPA